MGTQENRLDETVLFEHPKHMFKLVDQKIIAILRKFLLLNWPYVSRMDLPTYISRMSSFPILAVLGGFQTLMEHSVSKQ